MMKKNFNGNKYLSSKFQKSLKLMKNPYGNVVLQKIISVKFYVGIKNILINKNLLI